MNLKKRTSESIGWDLDGLTLKEVVEYLRKKEKELSSYKEIRLYWEQEDWGEGYCLVVSGLSPETDDEIRVRTARENDLKKQREDRERAYYERLAKKFKEK